MERTVVSELTASPKGAGIVSEESEDALNIALAYQNPTTRKLATEVCDRVTQLVGRKFIQSAAWKISDLARPEILSNAVRFAALADVIFVSVYAAEELPLDLYAWIDAWLPRRTRRAGALIALIGVSEQAGSGGWRTRDYLQAVARRGHLDFLPHEHKLPVVLSNFHLEQTAKRTTTTTLPRGILDKGSDAYQHWGINE